MIIISLAVVLMAMCFKVYYDTRNDYSIDYLVLVNKSNALPQDWEDKLKTEHFTNSIGDDVEVEINAYKAYLKLKDELEKEDIYVDLDSARRSVETQQQIMEISQKNMVLIML